MNRNWFSNRDVIRNSSFHDKTYLNEIYEEVRDYVYKSPTPIVTEWEELTHSIIFKIGSHTQKFKVSPFVASKDYITQIEFWASKYYPRYVVELYKEIPLDIEEKISAITNDGLSLDESLDMYKKEKYLEKGMISRVFLPEDKFTIIVNGKKFVRLSGTIFNPMPLSTFLKELRSLYYAKKNDDNLSEEIKKYIEKNSTLENKDVKEKEIEITYIGKKLKNFFIINRKELSESIVNYISPTIIKIGRFLISFDSENTKKEMLLKLETYKLKRNLKYDY